MIYLLIYWEFFKIGLFAIGGGLATLPFLDRLAVTKPEWYNHEYLADMIAVANSGPGPVGVNLTTTIGINVEGILGGICAVCGLITAPVIIVIFISTLMKNTRENIYINGAMQGLRPAVCALLALALWSLISIQFTFSKDFDISSDSVLNLRNVLSIFVIISVNILMIKKKIPIVIYMIFGAVLGIIFKL